MFQGIRSAFVDLQRRRRSVEQQELHTFLKEEGITHVITKTHANQAERMICTGMNKNVLCMSYYWSFSNGSLSPVFCVSPSCIYFIFVFCCIFLFVVVLFLICFLLYTVNSSQYFSTILSCFVFSCILFFLFS